MYMYMNIYIYIHNGILATKQNEILPFVATWIDFEGIMLSEISQIEKDKYHMISLMCGIQRTNKKTKDKINEHTKPNQNKHLDNS